MGKLDVIKSKIEGNSTGKKLYNLIKYIGIKYFYDYTLRKKFKDVCGCEMNLKNPKTFSEKIQWIKVNIHDPKMTKCADKLAVRDYVKQKIENIYIPEVYAIWKSAEEVNFDKLPNKFVLKANHGSGEVIVVKDKNKLDIDKTKKEIASWLTYNYYYRTGEWVYKDIVPKIYAEELLEEEIVDYKIFCFNGKVKYILLSKALTEDTSKQKREFIWKDWSVTPFTWEGYKKNDYSFRKPKNWDEMIEKAEKLSEEFLFCRVDLYNMERYGIIFSELTFYPNGGFGEYRPVEWEEKIGSWLKLPCDKEA